MVRETGQWEAWLTFFLTGIIESATDAIQSARDISDIFMRDATKVAELHTAKRKSVSVIFDLLKKRALISLADAVAASGLNYTPASNAFKTLVTLGIAEEVTGKKRNQVFAYKRYVDILSSGAEPLR